MSKSIKTLVKLVKQDLDEKRQNLNVFLDKKDDLLKQKEQWGESLIAERALVDDGGLEAQYAFAAYIARVQVEQHNIDQTVVFLDGEVRKLEGELADIYAELKKYEILLERQEERELIKEKQKEQIAMDEIGANIFRRSEMKEEGEF